MINCKVFLKNKYSVLHHLIAVADLGQWVEVPAKFLVILATYLTGGFHPEHVDSLLVQQLFRILHSFVREEPRPAKNPGVVDMEDAKDIGAGVDNRKASVVCCQNPVGAVGSNWEQKKGKKDCKRHGSWGVLWLFLSLWTKQIYGNWGKKYIHIQEHSRKIIVFQDAHVAHVSL